MTEQAQIEQRTGGSRRVIGSRRWWALVAVAAVLGVGLAYELIRYDHRIAGHLAVLVVAGLLAVGVVAVLVDPGRSRFGRAVLALALAVGLVFCVAQLRAPSDPLVADWTATFQGTPPSTVAITRSAVGYTVTAKAPASLPGSQCELPVGTVLATFDGSAPAYQGWQLVINGANCRLSGWEPGTFTLVDARSLQEKVPSQHNLLFARIG